MWVKKVLSDKPFLLAIVFLALAAFVFLYWRNISKVESKEFGGQIIKIEGNSIFMKGTYGISPDSKPKLDFSKTKQSVEVLVSIETEIFKVLVYIPPNDSGPYNTDDLKKEKIKASLKDLENNYSGIVVITEKNVYGKNKFNARVIEFYEPVYP